MEGYLVGARVDLVSTKSVYRCDVVVVLRPQCNGAVRLQYVIGFKTCGAVIGCITTVS